MAIDTGTRAEILRLHRAEGWPVGTIARHLGIHHSTVTRALDRARTSDGSDGGRRERIRMIDPYLPFIRERLKGEPTLSATLLHRQVQGRGHRGGVDHFRHLLRDLGLRPKRRPEASMRPDFLPAEQAQVDWVDFGPVTVGRAERKPVGFVMTLSHSRCSFLHLSCGADMNAFLCGHVAAFPAFGGVPRTLLHDNLKSAVTARRGTAVTWNHRLLGFAGHHAFMTAAAWPYRPQEKGRVERRIRHVRSGFMAGRDTAAPLDGLNAEARAWCLGPVLELPWPDDRTITVGDAFARERDLLLPLPDLPFPTDDIRTARVGKTPYVRFDLNDCSVPHEHVGSTFTIAVSPQRIRILDGGNEVAVHQRSWDRQRRIEDPEHVRALIGSKRHGRAMGMRDRLTGAVPKAQDFLTAFSLDKGNVASCSRTLTRLLDDHGADRLEQAIGLAMQRGSAHPNTVIRILKDEHRPNGLLPAKPGAGSVTPRSTGLDAYDQSTDTKGKQQ